VLRVAGDPNQCNHGATTVAASAWLRKTYSLEADGTLGGRVFRSEEWRFRPETIRPDIRGLQQTELPVLGNSFPNADGFGLVARQARPARAVMFECSVLRRLGNSEPPATQE
jgi:hypothetical protein